ncbi:MAG: hypothetical protein HY731_14065 [Candidatus Tectomicrobia bacterium]|nr:hypothetical protein [Candidatus Tectomicrobia bacterium]
MVGPYDRLSGRVQFALDPEAPAHREIVDLDKAPRNASGLVEFSTGFFILKPLEMARGNRRLIYDVVNRGNKRILQFFNDAPPTNDPHTAAHAGNGFLMRQGYTIVWSGWQGDLLLTGGQVTMELPTPLEDGREITGLVMTEFIADAPEIFSFPLSGNDYTRSYETATTDTAQAIFTCREHTRDRRRPLAPGEWQFARAERNSSTGRWEPSPSTTDCYLASGFHPGSIYELIYRAKNPSLLGLGFVGLRELISFLRYASTDADQTPNPLGDSIEKAYAWGRSQSGRFLRDFVYRGFNADASGRRVFDAIWPHVSGGGRIFLNDRFAQPGRFSRQHEDHLWPTDLFPFAYAATKDPFTGKTDSILKRPDTDPLVLHTQTCSEYWQRRGSLVHTDPTGQDLPLPETVRAYLFSSSQHMAAPGAKPRKEIEAHLSNTMGTTAFLRGLLALLDRWASKGTPPPASRIPTKADGTLVSPSTVHSRFPRIPGVSSPNEANRLQLADYGAEFERGIISKLPPEVTEEKEYTVLVPAVNEDGNDIPGLRSPEIEAPVATHTGWNPRAERFGGGDLAGVTGSYLPFPRTKSEREASDDPRPSLEERYRTQAGYVRAIARSVERLVADGFLLEEDADRYVEAAMKRKLFEGSESIVPLVFE